MDLLSLVTSTTLSALFTQTIVHPLHTLKVRLQLTGAQTPASSAGAAATATPSNLPIYPQHSMVNAYGKMLQQEGLRGPWRGLVPAWHRQAIYGTTRVSLFYAVKERVSRIHHIYRLSCCFTA